MNDRYKLRGNTKLHGGMDRTTNTVVKGVVDVTKVAVVGSVAMGLVGGIGTLFKK